MKAVILVGGEGTRLRPLTSNLPKPMAPLVNRPFLEHVIDYLKKHGVDEVILALCYLPDRIREHFGDGSAFGVKLSYVLEQSPLGTGGALKNVAHLLGDEPFVALNGDIFTDLDLTDMLELHRGRGAKATIALKRVEDPSAFGVIETDDHGRVKRFIEKPPPGTATSDLINAGIYLINPDLLERVPAGVHTMVERQLFPRLAEEGVPFYGYRLEGYWADIGTPQDYVRVHHDLLTRTPGRFPGEMLADGIWVEQGCNIERSAKLSSPLVIGRGCTIGPSVRVAGPAVLGPGCDLGQGCVVERSILWQNVRIGRGAIVADCVIASNCVIGDDVVVPAGSILGDNTVMEGHRLGQ